MSVRRMLPLILINIVVSAAVVLAILYWWDSREAQEADIASATVAAVVAPTPLGTTETLSQPTDTPEPDVEGPLTHVVKAGETLGRISQFYDVPMDEIMEANGIDNANLLSVGQELVIPVGGLATETPVPESASGPESGDPPTPIPADAPLDQGEAIVEITSVTGVGDLAEETIQITNSGSRQIAFVGWKLADAHGHVYTFGQVTLFGDGAAIRLHTEAGQDGPADLFWGLESPIWEPGERVTLLDSEENIQAVFDIP